MNLAMNDGWNHSVGARTRVPLSRQLPSLSPPLPLSLSFPLSPDLEPTLALLFSVLMLRSKCQPSQPFFDATAAGLGIVPIASTPCRPHLHLHRALPF